MVLNYVLYVCITASNCGGVACTAIGSLISKKAGYKRRRSIEESICVKGLCTKMNVSRLRAGSKRCIPCETELKQRSGDRSSWKI